MTGKRKKVSPFWFAALCALVLSAGVRHQVMAQQEQGVGARQIVAEEFTRARPAAIKTTPSQPRRNTTNDKAQTRSERAATNTTKAQPARQRLYRRASSKTVTATPPNTSGALEVAQLGITFWRLRPAAATDEGAKLSEQKGANAVVEWTPERVEAETPLRIGDRLRLSIESPRTGYLYVIDRELYADGTRGAPLLIFPTLRTRGGDNQVRAGLLVEIPAQEDLPPYFKLTRSRSDQTADLITVIVAPRPIEDLQIERTPLKLAPEKVAQWERMWGVPAERFEMDGGAGASWTQEEQRAGAAGRALTQEEPAPQTIYRVALKSGVPLLISVPLRYDVR